MKQTKRPRRYRQRQRQKCGHRLSFRIVPCRSRTMDICLRRVSFFCSVRFAGWTVGAASPATISSWRRTFTSTPVARLPQVRGYHKRPPVLRTTAGTPKRKRLVRKT